MARSTRSASPGRRSSGSAAASVLVAVLAAVAGDDVQVDLRAASSPAMFRSDHGAASPTPTTAHEARRRKMASKRDEIKAKLAAQAAQTTTEAEIEHPDPAHEAQQAADAEQAASEPQDGTETRSPAGTPTTSETGSEPQTGNEVEPVGTGSGADALNEAGADALDVPAEGKTDTRTKAQVIAAYKLAVKPYREQQKAHVKAVQAQAAKKPYEAEHILKRRDLNHVISVIEAGQQILTTYHEAKAAVEQGGKPPTIAWLARTVPAATSQDVVRQVLDLAGVDFSADANALSVEAGRKAREARSASTAARSGATRTASNGNRTVKSGLTREQADKKFMELHKAGKTMTEISTALGYEGRPIRNMYYKRLGVTPNKAVKAATAQPAK